MSRAFPDPHSRRWLLRAGLLALAASLPAAGSAAAPAPPRRRIVTLLGDSITAGYGLPVKAALPAQLEAGLAGAARVRGAGVSGDTIADGLARVDFSVQPDTDVCVVVLGGNDLLQGRDPGRARDSLDKIVKRLKARRITVVLVGLKAPSVIGAGYARDFDAIYPAVAKANAVTLVPNLLAGVAMDSRFNQRDGIHPNPAGVKLIAARLTPVIAQALKTRR